MPAFFIAATGTDIGKTFVTAGLVRILKQRGQAVAAIKPVASGYNDEDTAQSDAGQLLSAMGHPITAESIAGICPWRYTAALSPHMAAARESRKIDYAGLLDFTRKTVAETEGVLFIEGIGGVMVPLDAKHTTLDWMADMKLPLILVTGSYLGTISHTLTAVAALARRFGVRVVSDEIHAPLILSGARFVPYLSVPGAEDAFALMSASKAWNLAGIKAAVAIAGPEAAADLARIPEEVSHGPSHLGVIAHAEAFRTGGDWLDALLRGLDEKRALLGDLLAEHLPAVTCHGPQGTYLAWLDCRRLGFDDAAPGGLAVVSDVSGPASWFLEHARVALSSGHVFGPGGAGHVRLNFATSRAILAEAVSRMGRAVQRSG